LIRHTRWVMVRRRRLWQALLLVLAMGLGLWAIYTAVHILYPASYRTTVVGAARQSRIDPRLVWAIVRTESHFRPQAISPVGALGLMQITPTTGQWIATQRGESSFAAQQLLEPSYNVRTGTWYLGYLIVSFQGRIIPAIAAYNAGASPVRQWLATGAWSGSLTDVDRIPYPETRHFVQRVMRSYRIYRYLYANPRTG